MFPDPDVNRLPRKSVEITPNVEESTERRAVDDNRHAGDKGEDCPHVFGKRFSSERCFVREGGRRCRSYAGGGRTTLSELCRRREDYVVGVADAVVGGRSGLTTLSELLY